MATTVLIVDDHASFRASARRLLDADGYEVVGEAEDGARALAESERLAPDVVLLDVQLPDLDGFEVARRLAASTSPPTVVLVSSHDRADLGSALETEDVAGFIHKGELSMGSLSPLLG